MKDSRAMFVKPPGKPVVVLDTNIFYDNVEADSPSFDVLLEGVESGDFDLVIPSVVIDELANQYPRRIKRITREIRKAVGSHRADLNKLGIEPPEPYDPERDGDAYRERLVKRLEDAGASVREHPADLGKAISWAIARRKPFKQSGDGFQDAAIWLTVLELAAEVAPREVIFVSENTTDFSKKGTPPALADELRADVEKAGLRSDQVRYLADFDHFLERFAKRLAEADKRADRLLSEKESRASIVKALSSEIESDLLIGSNLDLGVVLDDDPDLVGFELREITIESASELGTGHLKIELEVEVKASIETYMDKGAAAVELDDSVLHVVDWDFNEWVSVVGADIDLVAIIAITTDLDASLVEASIDAVELAPAERARLALRRLDRDELTAAADGASVMSVVNYVPGNAMQSDVDEVTIDRVRDAQLTSVEVDDDLGGGDVAVRLTLEAECDISWFVSAPDPADDEDGDAQPLSGFESFEPMILEISAVLDVAGPELRHVVIDTATLEKSTYESRESDKTAADPAIQAMIEDFEREHGQGEP